MKKLLYISILFATVFTSCDPMEDINDSIADEPIVKSLSYTLTDDDYDDMGLSYGNFSSYSPAYEYLPEFLADNYATLDLGSSINVTYNYYTPLTVDYSGAYVIGDDVDGEYQQMGQSYDNFEDEDVAEASIIKLINSYGEYSLYDAGYQMTVQYTLYSRSNTRYIQVNDDFSTTVLDEAPDEDYYKLTYADYETLGYGKYHNFSYIDQAESGIALFAQTGDPAPGPGYYACVVYTNYYDKYIVLGFDGSMWDVQSTVSEQTEQYILKAVDGENVWQADPSVSVIMTSSDYQIVVDYVGATYGEDYLAYGNTTEYYYGTSAGYSDFYSDEKYRETSKFSTWQEAISTALAEAFLPNKYENAKAQIGGVDVYYTVQFLMYGTAASGNYTMQFKCTSSASGSDKATFEYVEGSLTLK